MIEQKLAINWEVPNTQEETGEYFENQVTKDWLEGNGVKFESEEELIEILNSGRLENITQADLKDSENITYKPEDFEDELKDEEYAESFKGMEYELVSDGEIILPAPIILNVNGVYYGFAGNRRMNLAFKYGIPLTAWVVRIEK